MDISRHATVRSQQRAIPQDLIDLIVEFGTPSIRPGGAFEYIVRGKDRNRMIAHLKRLVTILEKVTNKAVFVVNGQVVTAYHKKY